MQYFHRRFDRYNIGQIYGGDFAKCCGLLRIYEFYKLACYDVSYTSGSGFKNHGFRFDIFNFQSSKYIITLSNYMKSERKIISLISAKL